MSSRELASALRRDPRVRQLLDEVRKSGEDLWDRWAKALAKKAGVPLREVVLSEQELKEADRMAEELGVPEVPGGSGKSLCPVQVPPELLAAEVLRLEDPRSRLEASDRIRLAAVRESIRSERQLLREVRVSLRSLRGSASQ